MSTPTPTIAQIVQGCTETLVLALTAPTDSKAQEAAELAQWFAEQLTDEQVNDCKAAALKIAKMQMAGGAA